MPYEHLLRDPVLMVLVCGSLVSWAIIADRVLALRRSARDDRAFLSEKSKFGSLYRLREELDRHVGSRREHLLTILDAAIVLQRQRLERGLPVLGVIGSTAVYVGLLGTVIGIIHAFQAIQAHNDMSPSVVAGGIATALVATAMGLAVAIPAVAAHHLLTSNVNRRVAEWESAVARWLPDCPPRADGTQVSPASGRQDAGGTGGTGGTEEEAHESLPVA